MELPTKLADNILGGLSKLKLVGGVVGRLSYVLIAFCVAAAIIAFSPNQTLGLTALGLIFVAIIYIGSKTISFADRNPTAALFEGAELLGYHQLMLGQKDQPRSFNIELVPEKNPAIDVEARAIGDSSDEKAGGKDA